MTNTIESHDGPQWVCVCDPDISLGFKTMDDAERFVRSQSTNTDYLERWTFRISKNQAYGTEVIASSCIGAGHATLDLRKL